MSIIWRTLSAIQDDTFQCPITKGQVDFSDFMAIYGPFLETLDGRDCSSYVDFFFCRSPINRMHWEFVDEDARMDFIDLCRDMDLIPEMKDILDGSWSEKDKVKRKSTTIKIKTVPKQQIAKKPISNEEQMLRIQKSRIETLSKLQEQLDKAKDSETKSRIQTKLDKIKEQLNK